MTDLTEDELTAYRATCARRAADLLREQFGAECVVLFGSLARNEDVGPRSDINLAVAGLSADPYSQAVARVQRVGEERSVDLVRLKDCVPSLRERIDEEGIPL